MSAVRRFLRVDGPRRLAPTAASSVLGIAIVAITGMQLMSTLDGTIVIVALPRMQADLDLSDAAKSWVITAYVLAFGGLLLLGGRVGDAIGHKRAFLSGVGVFTIASLVCGAGDRRGHADRGPRRAGHRRRGRGADRAGADRDDVRRRARPQPRDGGVGGHAGHRLGARPGSRRRADRDLVAAGVSDQRADRHRHHRDRGDPARPRRTTSGCKLDVTGALLATLGCTSAVLVFTQGPPRGWIDPLVIGAAVASAVFFVAFLLVERTADHPIVPFSVFDNRNRVMTFVSLFLAGRRDADADRDDRAATCRTCWATRRCGPGSASSRSRWRSGVGNVAGGAARTACRAAVADHRRRAVRARRDAVRLDAEPQHPVLPRPVRADRRRRLRHRRDLGDPAAVRGRRRRARARSARCRRSR